MPASTASLSSGNSSDSGSEKEPINSRIEVNNNGSRKRRRLSPTGESDSGSDIETAQQPKSSKETTPQSRIQPTQTISRIKAKQAGLSAAVAGQNVSDVPASIVAAQKGTEKTSFAALDVSPWLVASLANMAIKQPTKIQSAAIPEILKGRDCIGGSRTGSGKSK